MRGPDLAQRWPRRPGHLNGWLSELRRAGAEVVSNLARLSWPYELSMSAEKACGEGFSPKKISPL